MASSGFTIGGTDNPFAMPTDTTGMGAARHGSAEQDAGSAQPGTYLNSLNGTTPPATPPLSQAQNHRGTRRTRARSKTRASEEDEDNHDRRNERQ